MKLILASSSPRRKELMKIAEYEFDTVEPCCHEILEGRPEDIVVHNARCKALSVDASENRMIIGCDTVSLCNGEILGKPVDEEEARWMLLLQQDHPCRVVSGLAVRDPVKNIIHTGFEVSIVEMDGGPEGVEEYLASGLWKGKAGAFGIQDRGPIGAKVVSGREDNVTGLPLILLARLLSLVKFRYPEYTPSQGKYD